LGGIRGRPSIQIDAKAESREIAVRGALLESPHANAAVGENDSLRRDVLFFGRQLDV
jgi:hypothetical protein